MDKIEELKKLSGLLKSGAISKEEFDILKEEVLVDSDSTSRIEIAEETEKGGLEEKQGVFTVSFDGQWFLIDIKTKIFVNDQLHSSHSTKKGFSTDIPFKSEVISLKVSIGGLKSTTYKISDLDIKANYHLRLEYDNTWGKYASNYNLEQNGKSIC